LDGISRRCPRKGGSWATSVRVGTLAKANIIDECGLGPADLPPGLQASAQALHSLVEFLQKQPHFIRRSQDLFPLRRLDFALFDLWNGTVSPMFRVSRGKKPPNGSGLELIKGLAARAVDELLRASRDDLQEPSSPEPAAQTVAQACGPLRGHGTVTGKDVINWREDCRRKPKRGAQDSPGRWIYRQPLSPWTGNTPRERANHLLEVLRQRISALV